MKNKFKLSVLIIAFIVFLSACGNDTDKFLQGTWKSKENSEHTLSFDNDKFTRNLEGMESTLKYKIKDVSEDIIYIESEPSKETNNSAVYRFQKEDENLIFLDYWFIDSIGEEIPGSTTDMQYEEFEKESGGSGIPNWVYIVGFIILVGIYMGWKNTD
ncbi:hypothetical protein QI139_08095 [Staphylococcus saprophyticus]|nr:hypothetical protein [Staphylococcus saprophyticus]